MSSDALQPSSLDVIYAPSSSLTALERIHERLLCGNLIAATAADTAARELDRSHACVPVLLCPIHQGHIAVTQTFPAITKDLSLNGLGVIARHPMQCTSVVTAVWDNIEGRDDPADLYLATVRHSTSIGGGFWQVGLRIDRRLDHCDEECIAQFRALAKHLLPPLRD